jgi:hypothetical protein
MNKNVLLGVLAAGTLAAFSLAKPVSANEGVSMLKSSGSGGACFVSSVFIDGSYKILGTCRDLKMALSPEKNKYVMWSINDKGDLRRLGEVANGKIFTSTDQKFVKLQVTVETDSSPMKPSEDVLLTGDLMAIDFGAGVTPERAIATPTPTQIRQAEVTTDQTTEAIPGKPSSLGNAVGTVFKIVLLGFGVLLLVVGVFSFLSRRRSL